MARVLITGCSSGFGLLAAVELSARGHEVVATMRDLDKAGPLRAEAEAAGATIDLHVLDVNDEASVDAVVEHLSDTGGLDVLVNNAGIEVRGPLELISDAEARQQFETNVFGLLRMVRAATPLLRESDAGVLVNVGSIAGLIARPFAGIYAASKHAVEAISEALHFELGLFGVRVHVIEPGQFPTELAANAPLAAAASDLSPDHPYRTVSKTLDARIKGLVPAGHDGHGGADAADVARAIADTIEDPDAGLRVPVGGDADLILAARSGNSFEDYEVLMRTTLDYWEGYRRERPD